MILKYLLRRRNDSGILAQYTQKEMVMCDHYFLRVLTYYSKIGKNATTKHYHSFGISPTFYGFFRYGSVPGDQS